MPLCGTSQVQSPINVPDQVVTFGVSALKPLNVSYGQSSDWMLEVTPNYLCALARRARAHYARLRAGCR